MSVNLQLVKILAVPSIIGSVVTPLVIPSISPFYKTSNLPSENKKDCYIIVSSWDNKKHLSVCGKDNSLKFYLVNRNENNTLFQEIEKVVSSAGNAVIVKLLNQNSNISIDGIKNKEQVINNLYELIKHTGLKNKCRQMNNDNNERKLICDGGKQIPLSPFQITNQ